MRSPRILCLAAGCTFAATVTLTGASIEERGPDLHRDGHSVVSLNGTDARVGMYHRAGRMMRLYGDGLAVGASPQESAASFVDANGEMLGVGGDDLRNERFEPLIYDRDTGTYGFTMIAYDQYRAGIPVFRGELRLLVRNEAGYPMVLVNPALRAVAAFDPAPAGAERNRAGVKAAQKAIPGLEQVGASRLVIYAGVDDEFVQPVLAHEFIADTGDPSALDYQKWLFVTDAGTGAVLYQENRILQIDVTGNVSGMSTVGPGAHTCGPEALFGLPYAEVNISGGATAFADVNGDFVIPHGGSSDVTVNSLMEGLYFWVNNEQGGVEDLARIVTPPGPADFIHNEDNTEEHVRSQVNAYLQANIVRDYILAHSPDYPTISTQTNFRINVNRPQSCNATYSGDSINFYHTAGGCPNTAYDTIVYHEYGHHLVATGGSGQGAYGEGMSDVLAVLVSDMSELAIGFFGDCGSPLRDADNTCRYLSSGCSTCGSAIHSCGQIISGCVWDTRNELIITEPDDYRTILSTIAIDAVRMHTGSSITPAITVDYLTLDDDNGNIFDGTPHYNEIAAGFGAHDMDAPELALLEFEFPDGLPELSSPSGATTVRVNVLPLTGEPEPDTGVLFWDNGGGVVEIPMTQISENEYEVAFPAEDCGTQLTYYFGADATSGFQQLWPIGAPELRFSGVAATGEEIAVSDNFETDMGWTVSGDAATGHWERGLPIGGGTRGDPPTDGDGSGQCFVTENGEGNTDVDDGTTTLTSPVFDASGDNVFVGYHRWYSNTFGSDPENDIFEVEVSDDGGATWANLETVGPSGPEVDGGWFRKELSLDGVITPGPNFRIRFHASDLADGSVVEAGVDGFEIKVYSCDASCEGDVTGDGTVDSEDLVNLLAAWGPCPGCPEDVDGNDVVDAADLVLLIAAWGPCE
jgi:hypothetical protein